MERNDSTPSRAVWIWGAGLVFVVVIAAVAFFTSRPADTPMATDAAVTTSGAALPGFSPDVALNDPAVGLPAPAVTGLSFNGDTVSVSPGDGTPKVLILLAHWCGICQREVPSLVQWSESGGDLDGVEVIAVATAGNTSIAQHAEHVLYVPRTRPELQPILAIIPLQLLAYKITVRLGLDVDRPRNLAKTVTVE